MRVLIVDDHQAFRDAFKVAITHMAGFTVVGEASTAREACELIDSSRPDLAVVDVSLKDSDGIALAHQLRRRKTSARVMMLSMHNTSLFARQALEAGATGYASKEQPLTEIIEAMKTCAGGNRYVSPLVDPAPPTDAEGNEDHGLLGRLSRREREVVSLVIQGRSSQAIAQCLFISLKTVETHRAHINRKLGVHSTAELIRLAALKGMLAGQSAGIAARGLA